MDNIDKSDPRLKKITESCIPKDGDIFVDIQTNRNYEIFNVRIFNNEILFDYKYLGKNKGQFWGCTKDEWSARAPRGLSNWLYYRKNKTIIVI